MSLSKEFKANGGNAAEDVLRQYEEWRKENPAMGASKTAVLTVTYSPDDRNPSLTIIGGDSPGHTVKAR